MVLLTSILGDDFRKNPLLILQSSLAQSSLPVIRHVLTRSKIDQSSILFCMLHPPSSLSDGKSTDSLQIYDWTGHVPGYNDMDFATELLAATEKALDVPAQSRPLNIILDSVDTLLEVNGSVSETYKILAKLYNLIRRHSNSRLILHSQSPSSLLPLITQTTFSSSLAHLIAHPPALITHLATEFLMPPPPVSQEAKFWSVFLPVSERIHDTERLIFGSTSGEGSSHPSEFVVELIQREGIGRKRGVQRVLEGWSYDRPCGLISLESLQAVTITQKEPAQANAPDPTQNLPFNLTLTSSQQESRAKVPLPYAHEGTPVTSNTQGAIFYDPDSADDIDDDDPDEDLDI